MSKKPTKQSRRTRARKERQAERVIAELPVKRARTLRFGDREQIVCFDAGVLAIMDGITTKGVRR